VSGRGAGRAARGRLTRSFCQTPRSSSDARTASFSEARDAIRRRGAVAGGIGSGVNSRGNRWDTPSLTLTLSLSLPYCAGRFHLPI